MGTQFGKDDVQNILDQVVNRITYTTKNGGTLQTEFKACVPVRLVIVKGENILRPYFRVFGTMNIKYYPDLGQVKLDKMYIKFFYDPFSFKPSERMRQHLFTVIDHELDHANYLTNASKEELERSVEEQRPLMGSLNKATGMAENSQALERAMLSELEKRAHVYSLDAQAKREGREFAEVLEEFLKTSPGQEYGLTPTMRKIKDAYLSYHAEKFPGSKVANWIKSILKFCAG